jgi:hypothetical protein
VKRLIFTLSVTAVLLLLFVAQNRFLFGISSVRHGMTQSEVYQTLGFPEFYETETDNWYFLKFYPFIFGAMNVKIDMRDFMSVAAAGPGDTGRTGDRVTAIEWKSAFSLYTKDNVRRLSH